MKIEKGYKWYYISLFFLKLFFIIAYNVFLWKHKKKNRKILKEKWRNGIFSVDLNECYLFMILARDTLLNISVWIIWLFFNFHYYCSCISLFVFHFIVFPCFSFFFSFLMIVFLYVSFDLYSLNLLAHVLFGIFQPTKKAIHSFR